MARHASGIGGVSMPSSSLRSNFSVHSMPSSCCLRLTPALGSHTRRMSMKLLAARDRSSCPAARTPADTSMPMKNSQALARP